MYSVSTTLPATRTSSSTLGADSASMLCTRYVCPSVNAALALMPLVGVSDTDGHPPAHVRFIGRHGVGSEVAGRLSVTSFHSIGRSVTGRGGWTRLTCWRSQPDPV